MKCSLAALAACAFSLIAYGQTPTPTPSTSPPPLPADGSPTASILFADGSVLPLHSHAGQFPLVLGSAAGTMTLQCRIPAAIASKLVIQSLDGGTVSSPSPVAADGTTVLQFQTGAQPGLYRVLLLLGGYSATMQFWVPNPNGDNPPTTAPGGMGQ